MKYISRNIYEDYLHLESNNIIISNIFENINIMEFPELKDFIDSNFIKNIIIFFDKKVIEKAGYDQYNKNIILHLKSKDVIDKVKPFKKDESDLYFSLKLYDSLSHEIQHAYDDFKSKGKFIGKKHENDIARRKMGIFDKDYLKQYFNLNHEINARITVAIINTVFYDKDYEETPLSEEDGSCYIIYNIRPFNIIKNNFIKNFDGWNLLSEKNKQNILHRLGKYYIEVIDYIKELNNKKEITYF